MSNNNLLGLVNTDAAAAAVPPRSSARESAQLASLLALHNNAAGGPGVIGTQLNTVRPGDSTQLTPIPTSRYAALRQDETPAPPVTLPSGPYKVQPSSAKRVDPVTHARSPFDPRLIFYTGRLKAGKDFVAAATGAVIFGFAEPLYAIRKFFFGEVDKDKHGAREFLQLVGQWGRGVVSAQYPLNASRATFTQMVRDMGDAGEFGSWLVDWPSFGRNENIWLDGMRYRVAAFREKPENAGKRVACVNVRFKNEHLALSQSGWTHFHVTCSTETWNARIRAAGLEPGALAMTDVSEQMAIDLDRQALQAAQKAPTRRLRCVWNDERVPTATPGAFHTLASFLSDLEIFS